MNTIITGRGFAILVFLAYLGIGPIRGQIDIIATVLFFALLVILLAVILTTLISGKLLKRRLSFSVHPPENASVYDLSIISGHPARLIVRVSPLTLLPLFELHFELHIVEEDLMLPLHQLTGGGREPRLVEEQITFPHRGVWTISHIDVRLVDQLGLSAFFWRVDSPDVQKRIEVNPPPQFESGAPVISSSHRAGDAVIDIKDRQGDPFDLKPYHPSDGMKKILWKIYAKRGELISRHPEPSMTPEGQVMIFCLADKYDDPACAALLAYVRRLEELKLELFVGAEGTADIARSAAQTEKLVVDHVWALEKMTPLDSANQLEGFLNEIKRTLKDTRIDRIVLFGSEDRFRRSGGLERFTLIGESLERMSIQPIYILTPSAENGIKRPKVESVRSKLVSKLFLQTDSGDKEPPKQLLPEFMRVCMARKWEVLQG